MAIYYDYSAPDSTVSDIDAINNSIKNILLTPRGSMPGRPRFGSELYRIPFEFIDHITKDLIKRIITSSIIEFEPRVRVQSVEVKDIPEYNRLIVTINYTYDLQGITVAGSTNIKLKD